MPNIMMFGFELNEYKRTKSLIDKTMQELGLGNDAVTTHILSEVESCDGKCTCMPYVRVCSTGGKEEINMIIKALRKNNIRVDCEKLPLPEDGFIAAKDMGS